MLASHAMIGYQRAMNSVPVAPFHAITISRLAHQRKAEGRPVEGEAQEAIECFGRWITRQSTTFFEPEKT